MYHRTKNILESIKSKKPLILNLTNYVTMDFVANGLLSIGASPVMSLAEIELADLLKHSAALLINTGTLNESFISLCKSACKIANELHIPIILDPVGAGATQYRTHINKNLLTEFKIAIIRGNASEIAALSDHSQQTKGVDSLIEASGVIENAKILSQQRNLVVAISGKTDIIVNHGTIRQFDCGSPLMPTITGTGCLLSAIAAAFHTAEPDPFLAAQCATLFYGICGELATKESRGPGSFKMHFLDTLSTIPEQDHYANY